MKFKTALAAATAFTLATAAHAQVGPEVGATVYESQNGEVGGVIGTIETIENGTVIVDIDGMDAPLPANAFGEGPEGPVLAVTKAQLVQMLEQQKAQAVAARDAALIADAAVVSPNGVAVGTIEGTAKQTIDAKGKVVAPGFIDVHTHYDAQVFWDGMLSPSCFHGVTSIFGGNCGFSIAPLSPDAGDYLMRMLARVEGMPLESLKQGVPWSWTSFGEYLDLLEGNLGVNAGFMVGHSAVRRVVMGERAVGHQATPDELAAMVRLMEESLEAGGMGFSSTVARTHNDGNGEPVPSRHASHVAGYCVTVRCASNNRDCTVRSLMRAATASSAASFSNLHRRISWITSAISALSPASPSSS